MNIYKKPLDKSCCFLENFDEYQEEEKLYFYEDFNNIDKMSSLKKRYKEHILNLEKFLIDKHYEKLFDTFLVYFITSNPIIDLDKTKSYIKTITTQYKKQFISGALFNFELHVKDEDEVSRARRIEDKVEPILLRLHSHSIIFINKKVQTKNMSHGNMVTHFFQKKIMGTKQSVDVKHINDFNSLKNHTKYILGIKPELYQQKNCKNDRIWRKTINIKDYYSFLPNLWRNKDNQAKKNSFLEEKLQEHVEALINQEKLNETFILTFE